MLTVKSDSNKEFSNKCKPLLQEILKSLNTLIVPNDLQEIYEAIKNTIDGFLIPNFLVSPQQCKVLLSHISSFKHYINFLQGRNLYSDFHLLLTQIEELYKLINKYSEQPKESEITPFLDESAKEQGTVLQQQDDFHAERKYYFDQLYLQIPEYHNFLKNIWLTALTKGYSSKRIFISYAWPNANDDRQEQWTQKFVEQLVKDLMRAGLQVYIDIKKSSVGFPLADFMGKIHKVDHVFVISTRTMQFKLSKLDSGVSYEYRQIVGCLEKNTKLRKQRFVVPVLLNNQNYAHPDFQDLAEVSFSKLGYLEALRQLIIFMYRLGDVAQPDFKPLEENLLQSRIKRQIYLPRIRINSYFVARKVLQNQLLTAFSEYPDANKLKIVYLHGMGGVGKTEFSANFMNSNGNGYSLCIWLNAQAMTSEYAKLAIDLHLIQDEKQNTAEMIIKNVIAWFMSHPGWLLILDDVSDYEAVAPYIPPSGGHILITTRNPDDWGYLGKNVSGFEVPLMNDEQAIALVGKRLANVLDSDVKNLADKLGSLPLAIAQAAAYISKICCTVTEYLRLFATQSAELLNINKLDRNTRTVSTTFLISLSALRKNNQDDAINFLFYFSYLNASNIPEVLLRHCFDDSILTNQGEAQLKLNAIKETLLSYSLISASEDNISLHPLLQTVIRDNDDNMLRNITRIIGFFAKMLEKNKLDMHLLTMLAPHIDQLIQHFKDKVFATININSSSVLMDFAKMLRNFSGKCQSLRLFTLVNDKLQVAIEFHEAYLKLQNVTMNTGDNFFESLSQFSHVNLDSVFEYGSCLLNYSGYLASASSQANERDVLPVYEKSIKVQHILYGDSYSCNYILTALSRVTDECVPQVLFNRLFEVNDNQSKVLRLMLEAMTKVDADNIILINRINTMIRRVAIGESISKEMITKLVIDVRTSLASKNYFQTVRFSHYWILAGSYYNYVCYLIEKNKCKEAIDLCQKYVVDSDFMDPWYGIPKVHNTLASAYIKLAKQTIEADLKRTYLDKAFEHTNIAYDKFVKQDVENGVLVRSENRTEKDTSEKTWSWLILGEIYFIYQDYESAIIEFEKILALNEYMDIEKGIYRKTDVPQAKCFLGKIALVQEDYIAAERYFRESLELFKRYYPDHHRSILEAEQLLDSAKKSQVMPSKEPKTLFTKSFS